MNKDALIYISMYKRRHDTIHCITEYRDQCTINGLIFMPVSKYGRYFFFSFLSMYMYIHPKFDGFIQFLRFFGVCVCVF